MQAPNDGAPPLPSALAAWDEITDRLDGRRVALFLDYDGTLTPIVDHPAAAVLAEEVRDLLRALADIVPVAVVSGRAAAAVHRLVELENVVYSGSHGFEILGPRGLKRDHLAGLAFQPAIEQAERELRARLVGIDGVLIERKPYSVAVHYRHVAAPARSAVSRAIDAVLAVQSSLRPIVGKQVSELRPRLDWDKGRAIFWLLETLELDAADTQPVYLGDDETDEDAFRALRARDVGVGIVVAERERPTAAHYRLADPAEVQRFLAVLTDYLRPRG